MEMLAQGRIRNAAEKAWGATKRATDALVLARSGEEPERSSEISTGLRMLESLDPEVRRARLVRRYYTCLAQLQDLSDIILTKFPDGLHGRKKINASYVIISRGSRIIGHNHALGHVADADPAPSSVIVT